MRRVRNHALPKLLGMLGAGVLVTGSFLVVPTLAQNAGATGTGTPGAPTTTHHVQPTYSGGNITSCPAGTTTFIVTGSDTSASYSTGGTFFTATVAGTGEYLSFTTDSPSFTVYVKGGPAYDTYDYTTTGYSSDTGLHAPMVGNTKNVPTISHYVVCGQPAVGPVVKATPSLTTHAAGPVTLGSSIHDSASLSGGSSPTGTITFRVYSTSSCGTLVGSGTVTVTRGTGTYTSTTVTPGATGTYYWTASYSGDTHNNAVTGLCGAATESSVIMSGTGTGTGTGTKTGTGTGTGTGTALAHLSVVKSSTPPSSSTVTASTTVTYTLHLSNVGTAAATHVVVTDTAPAGTTYKATSASCNGLSGCKVTVSSGTLTWSGITVPPAGSATLSFQVVVNATDSNGEIILNHAVFSNRGTTGCSTATCLTNTVSLTVVLHSSAATTGTKTTSTKKTTPPSTSPGSTPTGPRRVSEVTTVTTLPGATTSTVPSRISEATTVHTGEPWAGSLWAEIGVLGIGLSLLGMGEWLRRRRHPKHAATR